MIVQGTVLQIDAVNGNNDGQAYSYLRAHILDGIEVLRCKVADDYGVRLGQGEEITAHCVVTAYKDRREGARLAITLLSPVRDFVPAA